MATPRPAADSLTEKLRDPVYLARHLVATHALFRARRFGWYDAKFLICHIAAEAYLTEIAPELLDRFRAGFAPLHPRADFSVAHIADLLPEAELAEIRREVAAIPTSSLKTYEMNEFGRYIFHDHPRFTALQRELLPQVAQIVGVDLEPGYSFLSLYGSDGNCELHMDQPISMFTLDICIDQSHEWPIQFSNLIDWSTDTRFDQRPTPESLEAAGVAFSSRTLRPNEAIVFCGSSQWHYRRPFAQDGFCHLLFLHYFPAGAAELVDPVRWARHFAMPELAPLCDVFAEAGLASEPVTGHAA